MMTSSVSEIVASLDQISLDDVRGDNAERLKLVAAARRLATNLLSVQEQAYIKTYEETNSFAALMTCVDLGLFKGWTAIGGGEKSLDELLKLCQHECEPNLLRRLLRLLCATRMVNEAGEDLYEPTPFSLAVGDEKSLIPQTLRCRQIVNGPAIDHLPAFLAKTKYREPLDHDHTSHSDHDPEGRGFFTSNMADPKCQDAFSGFMTMWTRQKIPWPQYYDTAALLKDADLKEAPFVVDIGGHHGVDLTRVFNKHPDLPAGSLVLQDLPVVVKDAEPEVKENEVFRIMEHDGFDQQPVIGARIYFSHAFLHDWPDHKAVQILKNTAAAMKKGYSKVLICDIAIPPTGATTFQATMDVGMMVSLSAFERTEATWKKVMADSGLKFVKFWRDPIGYETIVEAELP